MNSETTAQSVTTLVDDVADHVGEIVGDLAQEVAVPLVKATAVGFFARNRRLLLTVLALVLLVPAAMMALKKFRSDPEEDVLDNIPTIESRNPA